MKGFENITPEIATDLIELVNQVLKDCNYWYYLNTCYLLMS